jgi:hypothetical protein
MSIWLNPRTLLIGLIVLGMAFTEGSANDWLAIGFIDDRGFDNGQGALVFGVFTVAMTVGRIAGVPLLDRFGRVAVLRGASLAAAAGLAVVILVPVIPIAIAGVVLWGSAPPRIPRRDVGRGRRPEDRRRQRERGRTVGYAAFLIGPPLIGFVGDHIGVLNALWIVLGLIIVATIAIPAAREPAKVRNSGHSGSTETRAPESTRCPELRIRRRAGRLDPAVDLPIAQLDRHGHLGYVAVLDRRDQVVSAPHHRPVGPCPVEVRVQHLANRNPVALGDEIQRPLSHRIHSSIEAAGERRARPKLHECVSSLPAAPSITPGGSARTCRSRPGCSCSRTTAACSCTPTR